jgi:6-phosphogluconolactonase
MARVEVIRFPDADALAAAVARSWMAQVTAALEAGRKHRVALSGGRIAKRLFTEVAGLARGQPNRLTAAEFFWADERCVPPDDAESNFFWAQELLFRPLSVSASSIHRINGELPPETGARTAAAELLRVTGVRGGLPLLDLVLLGMGEDGHVASLFPDDVAAASDRESLFLPVHNSPKPPPRRVSMGHGVIAAARQVWVLASGAGKQAALQESLSPQGRTPLAAVIQGRERTLIYSDIPLDQGWKHVRVTNAAS